MVPTPLQRLDESGTYTYTEHTPRSGHMDSGKGRCSVAMIVVKNPAVFRCFRGQPSSPFGGATTL